MFGVLTQKVPLTVPGKVKSGTCLRCHPHMPGDQMSPVTDSRIHRPSVEEQREHRIHHRLTEEEDGHVRHERNASFSRQKATRDFSDSLPRDADRYYEYDDARRGQQGENEEAEMVEKEIVNVLGEKVTVLERKKKKKKKSKSRDRNREMEAVVDDGEDRRYGSPQHQRHDDALHPSPQRQYFNDYDGRRSSIAEQKIPEDSDQEDTMDELQKMINLHLEETQQRPKFVQGAHFVADSELILEEMEDDPSVLTMPTVFADDGTVMSKSFRKSAEHTMPSISERRSSSTPGSRRSVISHEIHEPSDVPSQSEEKYLESAEELSPDIDIVRDIVRDCMHHESDEQAIEVVRQALSGTDSIELALFCLTTLWVLVRKSDENKRAVLFGANEGTRDEETPFGALIDVMIRFDSAEIQSRSCGVIWSLSMNPSDRKDVAQLGGCQAILQAMLMYTDDESLQVMAMGALKVLSCHVVGKSILGQEQASSIVSDIMLRHSSNPTIQAEGCAIICNLATGANQFVRPVTEKEINAILSSILTHPDYLALHEGACYALMSLSSRAENAEIIRRNPKTTDALELSFQKHPHVVGEDISKLLGKLRGDRPLLNLQNQPAQLKSDS